MDESRPQASRWSMMPPEKKKIYLEKHRLRRYARNFERWRRRERICNYDTRWLAYVAARLNDAKSVTRRAAAYASDQPCHEGDCERQSG
jgi:hypothetical protein